MFTATKLGDSVNKQSRELTVTVRFSDGVSEFDRDFKFSLSTPPEEIKRIIKLFLDDINKVPTSIPDGLIDFTGVVTSQDAATIEKNKWFRDFNKLEQLTKLSTLGALRPALATELDTLKASVAADFKKAYIADM